MNFFSQTAINEAVKVITERLGVTSDEITCTLQREAGRRFFVEYKKPGYFKCYVCGGRGHYAQICPSSRRATNQPSSHRRITQVRCYNCNQLGHILKYCTEPATGQSLNSQGPVGRAEQGPRVIKYGSIHKSVLQRINCSLVPTYSTIKGYSEDREY